MASKKWLVLMCWVGLASGALAQPTAPPRGIFNPPQPLTGPTGAAPVVPTGPGPGALPISPADTARRGDGVGEYFTPSAIPGPNELPPIPESWLISAFEPQPFLEVRAEAIFLQVNFADSMPLATQAVLTNEMDYEIYDVYADTDEPFTTGLRVEGEIHFNPLFGIQASGFYMDGPEKTGTEISREDLPYFVRPYTGPSTELDFDGGYIEGVPATFPTVADRALVDWDFETFNADVTLVRHFVLPRGYISDLTLGIGARYFGFNEFVRVFFIDELNNRTGGLSSRTTNRLAGAQFTGSARVQTPWRRVRISAQSKIGLMHNEATVDNFVESNGVIVGLDEKVDSYFAALFEGIFTLDFFITEHITLHGGYDLFYADRVARAGEQLEPNTADFLSGKTFLGGIFMHGPRVGVTISW